MFFDNLYKGPLEGELIEVRYGYPPLLRKKGEA